jgi:hypothetical protein
MQAIEFETRIENGRIVIPEQYQQTFGDGLQVKVIVLKPEPVGEQPSLHTLLSQSPLSQLDFGQPGVQSPVRAVEL